SIPLTTINHIHRHPLRYSIRIHHPPPSSTPPSSLPSTPSHSHSHSSSFTLPMPAALPSPVSLLTPTEEPRRSSTFSYPDHRNPPVHVARRLSNSFSRRRTSSSLHSLTDLPPDDETAKLAEFIRQRRAARRKRREDHDDDLVLVGTKVGEDHQNYVTAYNMLTGIRVSVSRTNAKLDRELTDADFYARHKYSFDISGNELTPSAKYDFKFKDYAPWVFRHLRAQFGLDPADYLVSLTSKYILSELGSPGKSGSFFYFSRDYRYIIKTIHHSEHKFLRKILHRYFQHIINHPNTLISQFYGLHRVKMPFGRKIHFVIMNNLFPPHNDIHQTFDLKGSLIGRDMKEDVSRDNPRATLKDLNWIRRDMHLHFGPTKRDLFLQQVRADVQLLEELRIMDYSLLVGIHDLQRGNKDNIRDSTLSVYNVGDGVARVPSKRGDRTSMKELRKIIDSMSPVSLGNPRELLEASPEQKKCIFYQDGGGFKATNRDDSAGDVIYYLGIIDCLTQYGVVKRLEHFWKGLSQEKEKISAVPPNNYGERFFSFISTQIKSQQDIISEREGFEQPVLPPEEREKQAVVLGTVTDESSGEENFLPVVRENSASDADSGRGDSGTTTTASVEHQQSAPPKSPVLNEESVGDLAISSH
ncbi:Phosphatidylinositol 4-phosphate 5-kinase its3, partial [Neolecta irregularis DAH-3]